jgi:steroid delta-isomerase-like uncharacterized protein
MSTADNIEIVKQAYAAWNAHDPDQYVQLIADDYVWDTDFFPAPVRGAEETKKAMSVYFTAFPDLRMDIETTIAADNHVVICWTVSGTHQGEFMGIPATHKNASVRGCTVTELRDGKIVKSATYSDRMTLFQQLGLAKSASAS